MIRRAEGGDVTQIVELLLYAKAHSPYQDIPLQRGRVTRQVALNVAKGLSWVREEGDEVKACCLVDLVESIYGLPVVIVQAVYGEGGFWLLKKVAAYAKQVNASSMAIVTSMASDDARTHEMVKLMGGRRTGSTYEVHIWASSFQ